MTTLSRSTRQLRQLAGRLLNRVVAFTLGTALMVIGIAMMVTIFALPVGVVLTLLGVMIIVYGISLQPDNGANG